MALKVVPVREVDSVHSIRGTNRSIPPAEVCPADPNDDTVVSDEDEATALRRGVGLLVLIGLIPLLSWLAIDYLFPNLPMIDITP